MTERRMSEEAREREEAYYAGTMKDDYISRKAVLDMLDEECGCCADTGYIFSLPGIEVVRCKDCVHQQKVFHEDKRIKEGGYYICGCELADGYSVVCLDGDFCSRGKRRADGTND